MEAFRNVLANSTLTVVRLTHCERTHQLLGIGLGEHRWHALHSDRVRPEWLDQQAFSTQLLGLSETALKMTAAYLRERQQFGVPIGTFQAVSQRVGDAFIALETMRVSLWRAAWLESEGRSSAFAVASARYLATKGAHQIVSAAQHLHGGMGFDRDYPLHRYFLGVKRIEYLEGGASAQLQRLGDLIAERQP